ncbi:hypothetical protein AMTRI_Chr01g133710 [Amborella trichopoda]
MANHLKFLPCRKSAKKRTNPEERPCFDPLPIDELTIILLLESDEETWELIMKTLQSVMDGEANKYEAAESFDPKFTMSGVIDDDGEEDALYRGILEDMGLDYEVPSVVILQAIKEKKKA